MSELMVCRTCQLNFLSVTWLPWRADGYCSEDCAPEPDEPAVDGSGCQPYRTGVAARDPSYRPYVKKTRNRSIPYGVVEPAQGVLL